MTKFIKIDFDWELVKNCCRSTVKKAFTEGEPSNEFKRNLVISEHSPIRELTIRWEWENKPYWSAMHWARHKFEKYIQTQRNDRQSEYDRDSAPQNTPVNYIGSANLQHLIDSFRKRLCFTASKETRQSALDFKFSLAKIHPIEASVLVPHCVYRGGCSEMLNCGHYKRFLQWWQHSATSPDFTDIKKRYSAYTLYLQGGEK